MQMNGSRTLSAPPAEVWEKLNDTDVLQRSIPGCETLERRSDTEMTGVIALKVGPVSARFSGDVTLSDIDPPNGYTISGSGKGGAAGGATGGAKVRLAEADGGGTLLTYDVEAKVSGKLAQLGGRLIDATAAKLSEQFFDNFEREFAAVDAVDGASDTEVPPAPMAPQTAAPPAKPSRAWLWVVLAAAAAALAYAVMT